MASQTLSRTLSDTRSTAAAHHDSVIRVYDDSGNVVETHEHKGDFKEWWCSAASLIIHHSLRCGFAKFKLCAHFLDLHSPLFHHCSQCGDFFLLLGDCTTCDN